MTGSVPGPSSEPKPGLPSEGPFAPSSSQSPMEAGFAKMLGPFATQKDVQQAINQLIKSAINQIKHDQEEAVKAIREARRKIEEGD